MAEALFYSDLATAPFQPVWQHSTVLVKSNGRLDRERVGRSLRTLVASHPILRCRLTGPLDASRTPQKRATDAADCPNLVNIQAGSETSTWDHVRAFVNAPFDLERESFRYGLVRGSDGSDYLALVFPHMFSDGHSVGVITRQFCHLYTGEINDRTLTLPNSFEYGSAERRALHDGDLSSAVAYWETELRGARPILEPALGHSAGNETAPTCSSFTAPTTWAERWASRSAQLHVAPSAVLLGAVASALATASGQDDVTLQVVHDPRRGRFKDTLGHLSDRLLIRMRGGNDAVSEAGLRQANATLVRAIMRHVPVVYLYENAAPAFERWTRRGLPGCDVMVNVLPHRDTRTATNHLYPDPQPVELSPMAIPNPVIAPQDHAGLTLMVVATYGSAKQVPIEFYWGRSTVAESTRSDVESGIIEALAGVLGVDFDASTRLGPGNQP